ncbi:hypothetical protein NQ314_019345 [Rhamnusium bicolor]|uniref:Secreted protein n=1 Tax=Rhamnusium bicolor TaxID=1586634 RepID=A0AAV8WN17_9CUCU|nr:hypothetical protein NQ314_019345 [Rhamnusium bicolor]
MSRLVYIFGIILLVNSALSVPVKPETTSESEETYDSGDASTEPSNGTQNLYVIKSVVYEIGILTDGNDSDSSNETHEQVDVSFYDPGRNGSLIDLSRIPIPIQTNVSGVAVTGILPTDLGSINLNDDGTASYNGSSFPVLPNAQVTVTHNISTIDKDKSASILSGLPEILGLDKVLIPPNINAAEKEDENTYDKEIRVEKLSKTDDDKESAS